MQRCKGTQVKRGREIELITKTLFSSEEPKFFTWYRSPVPAVWEKSMIRLEIYKKKNLTQQKLGEMRRVKTIP